MSDKVYLARPNWAILDIIIMLGAMYGFVRLIEWLTKGFPAWVNWVLFPFELALFVLVIIGAYHATVYSKCDGDYDKYE